jgi:hypothetical protein
MRRTYKVPADTGVTWWSYAILPFVATYWFFALIVAVMLLLYVRLTSPRCREPESGAPEGGKPR